MLSDLDKALDAPFTLSKQRADVPALLRPARRITILLLILDNCRGKQATLPQLHILDWAIRSAASRSKFLNFLSGKITPDQAIIRFDPVLTRAVNFALGLYLVEDGRSSDQKWNLTSPSSTGYRIRLTETGKNELDAMIAESPESLIEEQLFFERIGKKVSQSMVKDLLHT